MDHCFLYCLRPFGRVHFIALINFMRFSIWIDHCIPQLSEFFGQKLIYSIDEMFFSILVETTKYFFFSLQISFSQDILYRICERTPFTCVYFIDYLLYIILSIYHEYNEIVYIQYWLSRLNTHKIFHVEIPFHSSSFFFICIGMKPIHIKKNYLYKVI